MHYDAMPEVKNELGKLTPDQIRQLLEWLPRLDPIRADISARVKRQPERFEFIAPDGLCWADAYEHPIEEILAGYLIALGRGQFVIDVSKSPDSTQALLDSSANDEDDVPDISDDPEAMRKIFGSLCSILNSFESLMVYGYYLNELVAIARERGPDSDKALLNAVRIDPTVIAGPTGSRRLTRAVVFDDVEFLKAYRLALEGKTGGQASYLRKFRFVIQLLAEAGAIGLPNRALTKLVIDVGAYADVPGSEKNVSELIRKAKTKYAI